MLLYYNVRYILASINHDVNEATKNPRIDVFSLKLGNVSNTWTIHTTNMSKNYPGKPREVYYL